MLHVPLRAPTDREEQLTAQAQNIADGFRIYGSRSLYSYEEWRTAADSVLTDLIEHRIPDYSEMDWMDHREAAFERFGNRDGCFETWLDRNGLGDISRKFEVAA